MITSIMNGRCMKNIELPTNRMMLISFLRVKIVSWIELKIIKVPPMMNIITIQNMIWGLKSVTLFKFFATDVMIDFSWTEPSADFGMFVTYREMSLPFIKFSISGGYSGLFVEIETLAGRGLPRSYFSNDW
ncbi:MAG: hypothetical protein WC604_03140 [Candidatus Gracilibacteria bacterium]